MEQDPEAGKQQPFRNVLGIDGVRSGIQEPGSVQGREWGGQTSAAVSLPADGDPVYLYG